PCGSPISPPGLFGSLSPSLLAFTLHRPWSIGVNLSLNLHHAPSTAMSHPSPAYHKPRATSYTPVLSITHHTKGANLPWFLMTSERATCPEPLDHPGHSASTPRVPGVFPSPPIFET